ncbi:MAG TPA: pantoate--beta-alanine ligase [Bacteroidetes bacterium]|nr:pantoate--beta-alanine ligase [Bacteroidota bacterium]
MQIIHKITQLRESLSPSRKEGLRIGLVPTMGALHDGHLKLIREARKHCDIVVVSIFVNPTQFGPSEDLDKYPRTLDSDAQLCENEHVDYVFAPSVAEIYPDDNYLQIQINKLADNLCGASRPGHFNGVLQVVNKFFQIVQPDEAFFGQKDIQQFVLIQTMVDEFNIPVILHAIPTVRESDGLALSSRNRYLSSADRDIASNFYASLQDIKNKLELLVDEWSQQAEDSNVEFNRAVNRYNNTLKQLQVKIKFHEDKLTEIGFKIDYLEVVDFKTLQPVESPSEVVKFIVAGAVYLGNTRLIDNIIVENN